MALMGMGTTVQCDGYFPGYHSARDLVFESEGSKWTSSNVNQELKNDCNHIGSFPVSSSFNLVGYDKESLKQTILNQEAIFRDQIHELHRIYKKQRELMEEVKRNGLYEHNLRLEASWSGSSLSSKNSQTRSCLPNLPLSTGQSSVLIADSILLPLASAQEKSGKICPSPAPSGTLGSCADSKLLEARYRKIGKKVLDLQLPADEYIDSEDSECLENERVTEVSQVSAYPSNGTSYVQFQLGEAASQSYHLGVPAHHRNNPYYDLSSTRRLISQNFPDDVIRISDQKKHDQLSSGNIAGQNGGALNSFHKVIYSEKQSISVDPLRRNMEQFNDPRFFRPFHQVSQPWIVRRFSTGESSSQTQGFTINGLLGPTSASHPFAQYQLASGDSKISGISPAECGKTPVSDCGRSPIEVQGLPFFRTSASVGQGSKSSTGISGFTLDELHRGTSGKSGLSLDNSNFLPSSRSKLLDLPTLSNNDPNINDKCGSSINSHELQMYVKVSKDAVNWKNLNLNMKPAGHIDTTASESIQVTSEGNKFQDSIWGLPWPKEKPVCKGKPSEESDISTQIVSVVTNSCREKTPVLHCNEKPQMSSSLQSEVFQNQSKSEMTQGIEKGCISNVKSDLGKQNAEHMMKNKQKKFVACIIDLNSSMIEDENMVKDADFHAPVSPENKECSPPRGESDENQIELPFQLAGQEDPEVREEQAKVAAEALVSISRFLVNNGLQLTSSSSEPFASDPLEWFATIVSTAAGHPENKTMADFSSKVNNLEELPPANMDYFEFMTLNLKEEVLDCCHKIVGQTEQLGGSISPIQPRKGRANRGRWRKDFQSEILPSLASLSRYEVTEDLQIIGGLVAAGTPLETPYLRSAGKNVSARGRKRSCDSQLNWKMLSSITGVGIEKGCPISWGETCKKRRGKRVPATDPKHILNQVYTF